jgi:ElaB/YqjD/DUF883 family membrane-anchored ribosome-binding protein
MSNQACLQENWDEIREKLRKKWKEVTDDDLNASKDNLQNLVDVIQRKTGEASENVEKFVGQILSNGNSAFNQASDSVRDGAQRASASVRQSYAEVESVVRHRPAASVAIGLAVGVLAGITLSLLVRRQLDNREIKRGR